MRNKQKLIRKLEKVKVLDEMIGRGLVPKNRGNRIVLVDSFYTDQRSLKIKTLNDVFGRLEQEGYQTTWSYHENYSSEDILNEGVVGCSKTAFTDLLRNGNYVLLGTDREPGKTTLENIPVLYGQLASLLQEEVGIRLPEPKIIGINDSSIDGKNVASQLSEEVIEYFGRKNDRKLPIS